MNLNSPLFDRIRTNRDAEPEARPEERLCDHPGCANRGEHRAPMGRGREGQFFHFCLEHVRAYNATYNYFAGMSDEAVADYQKEAAIGHRPTWKLGSNAKNARVAERGRRRPRQEGPEVEDVLGLFGENVAARRREEEAKARITEASRKALEQLGLDPGADKDRIKARYKELVKRFHPDSNGGDRSRETRLTEIVNAYNHLRKAGVA